MRSTHMVGKGASAKVVSATMTLVLMLLTKGVTSDPQGQFVSQNVDDNVDYQQQGRGGDEWWRNYEVVEDHIDDLDDQLEMLYMYSVNPLELSTMSTTSRPPPSNRFTPVQSFSSESVSQAFDPRNTKPIARATFTPLTTTTTSPPPRTTSTYSPYPKSSTTVPSAAPIQVSEQPLVPFDGLDPHSQRNRVRVIVRRPSSGQKVNVPIKESESKASFLDGVAPQKSPFVNSVPVATKSFDSAPIPAESDPVPRTFPSPGSPLRISQDEQIVLTAATYRSIASTAHPFLASETTVDGQLPRYSKLLNRYSLLDTVSRDLNSASSEHRDDLTLAVEDVQREHSLRQTRYDVQAPSARSFRSHVEQQEESLTSTELPITSSKRSRRRRPKTSPVPPSTEWSEQTRSVDWDISSTDAADVWDEGRVSRRPTQAVRTAITTLSANNAFPAETTLPPVHEVVPLVKHVPESRGIISGSRRRTPSTSSPATVSVSSTSGASVQSVARHSRYGRTQGGLFAQTVTPPLSTDDRSTATVPSTVTESLRTTHPTTSSSIDDANDVLATKPRTSSLLSRNLRQRTVPFTVTTKSTQNTTEATLDVTSVTSKSKDSSKFKPRGTSAPRRALSFTTATTTLLPINNSTDEQKPTQRTSFTSSRFRFRPSSTTDSSVSSSTSTSTISPASTTSGGVSVTPTSHSEEVGRRKFKPRPSFSHSQDFAKPVTTGTSTTLISTISSATTDGTVSETTVDPAVNTSKGSFTKKFRPRPSGFRFQASSTTESAQPLTPGVTETIADTSDSSSFATTATVRSFSRVPLKTKTTPPLTRLSSGSPPVVTTTLPLSSSAKNTIQLETVSGSETELTEPVTDVIGKRRRRPIGTKKTVPSTSPPLSTASTNFVSPLAVTSGVGFTRKSGTTTTTVAPTESTFDVTTNSSIPERRKFRRRKITQRSTLSGPEEHVALNATTISKTDHSSTASVSLVSTTTSSVTETLKPTTEVTKKTLFGVKTKRNETDVKSGKETRSVPLLSLEGGDVINLQADESGDSVWFSSSGSNVDMSDDALAQGTGKRGSSRLLSVDDRGSWFQAAPDGINSEGADSDPEIVKTGGESIDTRPLLISRISDDLDSESQHETSNERVETEEEKPKEALPTRSATFSVSSSTSVRDSETSKTSSSSKSEPSADTSKDDDAVDGTTVASDSDHPKFIIIDKTALRGRDDDDEPTEKTNEEQDEKKVTLESKTVSDEEEKSKETVSTSRTRRPTTARTTTTETHVEDSGDEEEKSEKKQDQEEVPITTSKPGRRGNSKDDDSTSRRATTTSKSSKSDEEQSSTSRSASRRRSSSPSRRQQSSMSTVPTSTTEDTSTSTATPENEKPPSDTAVSYFGEDEESPSDHGALDDINGEAVEAGAAESSYDPESPVEEAEGHEVSADTVMEHSDPDEDAAHKTESAPVTEGTSSSSGEQWGLSPLSEFSGPIRSSSSINVEVLSRAPKLIQLAARREAKSSRSGVDLDDVKTRSRQSLRNILKAVGVETFPPSTWESSTETPSENSTRDSAVVSTTKRDVSSINKFVYPVPPIKTAADIAELFDAITSPPSDDVVQPFQPPSKAAILKINNTTAGTKSAEDTEETLTLQSLNGPANCSKAERNICPKSEDYPREVVDLVIQRHEETLKKLWSEIKADRINARLFAEEPERKKEELSVCDSSIEDLQPGWAKDAATGKWMIILNTPQYPQVLRIESCQRPQRECLFISPYYKSTCVEHYSVHRLVGIRSDDPSAGPVVGVFKFPCGCSCKVEMFHGHNH